MIKMANLDILEHIEPLTESINEFSGRHKFTVQHEEDMKELQVVDFGCEAVDEVVGLETCVIWICGRGVRHVGHN